ADEHVAALAALLEPQMREVRRRDVDGQRAAAAEPRLQRREPRHLLDQRRKVFGARFADLIAEREQIAVEIRRPAARARGFLAHRDTRLYLAIQSLFFGDDGCTRTALGDFGGHEKRRIYPNP